MVKHRESKAAISLQVQDIIIFDYQKAMVPQLNYICPFVLVSIPWFQKLFFNQMILSSVFAEKFYIDIFITKTFSKHSYWYLWSIL